ncbi:hypothetical protein PLEOSDRAFT_1086936 [Pleurotus ostreatus PC15]|uniref:EF-hand domain-containing protein n=1 Tax=Pleurotus ostreatus (strain PC15) TaxID=1137138 RepID=A0A067N2X5_PLEO1|nr:hypothetical protein PLEOSDRAFT_1086936 [Pleurotus ostreatus PC15]
MSASSSALGEAAFAALPKTVQAKIDNAFTSISRSNPPHRQTHSEPPSSTSLAGGFIVEDAVVAETDAQRAAIPSARIPLASIPAALELLDLPPHDRQILAVFRDAAESDDEDGDDTAGYGANGGSGKEASVSRSQWRAVCAVLLEGSPPSPSPSSPSPSSPSSRTSPSSAPRQREERNTRPRRSKAAYASISAHPADADTYESGDDSEPYVVSDNSDHSLQQDKDQYDDDNEDGDDSGDEYTGHAASPSKPSKSTKATKSATHKSAKKSASKARANAVPDSAAALDAFALFFPSTPRDSNELQQKKITLRDLQAAMKSAGEKYKADDLTEMLALFSTSPDKSISLADFANIMAATGLA